MPEEVDPLDEARAQHASQAQNGTNGVGAAKPKKDKPPQGSDFENKGGDAHLLWGELLAAGYQGEQFRLNIRRLEPPTQMGTTSYPALDGSVVRSGADALYNYIAEYYHLPSKQRGQARFEVTFFEKLSGRAKTRGYIVYPHQDEILAARPQVVDPYASMGGMGGMGGAPQQPRPWQANPAPAVHYAPPPSLGAPQEFRQPAPGPSSDPIVAGLQAQVADLNGQLRQVLSALGQAHVPQAAPVAVPQAPQITGLKEFVGIIEALRGIGIIPPGGGQAPPTAPVAVAAAPAPVAAAVPQDPLGQLVGALEQLKGLTRVKNAASEVLEGLAGVDGGDPKEPEAPAGEAALPWQRVQLGNFAWAISKEDGSWSPQGILAEMMNAPEGSPLANTRSTVLDLAGRLVKLGEAFARKGIPGLPQGGGAPPAGSGSPPQGSPW